MIRYTKFVLKNGLTVIHHEDKLTQLCVVNTLYKVGSKDEDPNKTGFAHLFEHLMFSGSKNVPDFDGVLQNASGENNAFTTNDYTNYYITLPKNNIELGFWLESDRMFALNINTKALSIQKKVVIEEYKERYLNQPYGDIWLNLLPLVYKKHSYRWPTIGRSVSHISKATLNDVRSFYKKHYGPNNAILVVAGNIPLETAKRLTKKWFEEIPRIKNKNKASLSEPKQLKPRSITLSKNVPLDVVVKAFRFPKRLNKDYYLSDLLCDIIGSGESSRLFNSLVKERAIFSEVDCYLTGDIEDGLLIVEGRVIKGVDIKYAEGEICNLLNNIVELGITVAELKKVKNKTETVIRFNNVDVLNKAMKLAYCALLGNIELVNLETANYNTVSKKDITKKAGLLLSEKNCSTIFYRSK